MIAARIFARAAFLVATAIAPAFANESEGVAAPPLPAPQAPPEKQVELGRQLFFESRLSGDASISCAYCHSPEKAYSDGKALSEGYPSTLYFRNTKALYNVGFAEVAYWDGRLSAKDLPTVVRDHLTEAHFMQADGRLLPERLKQVPQYEKLFQEAFGGEPTFGRILESLAVFLKTIRTTEAPFDKYLRGESGAISSKARKGWELFNGKARCTRCHSGPLLSDQKPHALGLAGNDAIFSEPTRHISFRRFFKTFGVADYFTLRSDPGYLVVTQQREDAAKFITPSLWEVSKTAPYMHNGLLATLEEVVSFYDRGAGGAPNKDAGLRPLGLSSGEREELIEFLKSLAGKDAKVDRPAGFDYALRTLGKN